MEIPTQEISFYISLFSFFKGNLKPRFCIKESQKFEKFRMKLTDAMSFTSFQQSNCKETSHGLLLVQDDNTTLIIGSTCGAVLFIVLFISMFVLCLRRMEVNLSRKAVSQFVVPKSSLREDNIEDFEEAVNLGKLFLFRTQFTIKPDLFFLESVLT